MEYKATGICFVWKSKVRVGGWKALDRNIRESMSFESSVNKEFLIVTNEVSEQLSEVGIISEERAETETRFEIYEQNFTLK